MLDGPRRRILEVTLLLFARQGFHGTSVRDIADALGQRPSALYKHFVGKDQILAELVHLGFALHHQWLLEAIVAAGPDPVTQLCNTVSANCRAHATYPLLAVVVNEELHALPDASYQAAMTLRAATVSLLSNVIQLGVDEGVFDVDDVYTTVAAVSSIGVRVPFWFRDPDLDIEALCQRQCKMALRMVGAPVPSR